MKKSAVLLVLFLSLNIFAQDIPPDQNSYNENNIYQEQKVNHHTFRDIEAEIFEKLEMLENEYLKKLSRKERKRAKRLLYETKELVHQLRNTERVYPKVVNPNIIDPNSFAVLLNEVKNSVFDSDKEKIIYTFTRNKMILTGQANELILLYRLEWDRFDIFKMIYPAIIDKENIVMLLPLFSGSIYKDRFIEFINENSL